MELQNIEESLQLYIQKSKEFELSNKILQEKRNQFDIENSQLISDIVTLDSQMNNIKDSVKEQAESQYKTTGEKKMLGGIGIRILTKLKYESENAIAWARDNMPIAIKEVLDKKQFEAFAKNNELGCWVEKEESICVTFPKEIKL